MSAEVPTKKISLYKASAGSGKTFTLVREYLGIVLRRPASYRNILAITFTNKAAGEMKDRILKSLGDLANGKDSPFLQALQEDTGLSDTVLRQRAREALGFILHDYGNFAVSTIDSFTYRLVRTFSRDLGLPGRFDVEIDADNLVQRITDQLLDVAGKDEYVTKVLTKYAEEKLLEAKSWNIEDDIRQTSKHVFHENSREHIAKLISMDQDNFLGLIRYMREQISLYEERMMELARSAMELVERAGLPDQLFAHGSKGYIVVLRKLCHRQAPRAYHEMVHGRLMQAFAEDEWASKSDKKGLVEALLAEGFGDRCRAVVAFHEAHYPSYISATLAYGNIYSLALLRQIEELLEAHKERHKMVHISDFQKKISEFLASEAPDYIYWRLGEKFRHYLLDEFQDTSQVQWSNMFPLLEYLFADEDTPGSLLIVGDSKQAIYRWRGGDVGLMEGTVPDSLGVEATSLEMNFRSQEEVVQFNNQFFTCLRDLLSHNPLVQSIYQDFEQKVKPQNVGGGYVEIQFLQGERNAFKDIASEAMVATIAQLIEQNYSEGDIAVLVRTKDEGDLAAEALTRAGHRVVSPESLLLTAEPAVNFIVSLLRFLNDPALSLARAEVLHYLFHYHQRREQPAMTIREILEGDKSWREVLEQLPPEVRRLRNRMDQLPLYEMAEEIIRIFELGGTATGYLQHFLDVVLSYSERNKPDVQGFLDFWEENKSKSTVKIPQHENAIRILTIHKSKGLEFPVVIVPYANWKIEPKTNSTIWTEDYSNADHSQPMLVPFQKALGTSLYSETYRDELERTLLDNVNLLYVAFTRPEDRLYILCPKVTKVKPDPADMTHVQDLVLAVADQIWPDRPESDRVERGIPIPRLARTVFPEIPSPIWISERWRDRIRVERKFHRYKDLFTEESSQTPFLILLREALRRIRMREDAGKVILDMVDQGILPENRIDSLRTKLELLLHTGALGDWFTSDDGGAHRTSELITQDGEILRPDKVMRTTEGTSILQFTLSSWEQEDREMLLKIQAELEASGEVAEMWLYHLDREKLEKVAG